MTVRAVPNIAFVRLISPAGEEDADDAQGHDDKKQNHHALFAVDTLLLLGPSRGGHRVLLLVW